MEMKGISRVLFSESMMNSVTAKWINCKQCGGGMGYSYYCECVGIIVIHSWRWGFTVFRTDRKSKLLH